MCAAFRGAFRGLLPLANPEDRAYTAGLLHDIGRLGLFVSYPDTYSALLGQTGKPLREREVEAFGFDHCAAGGWLAAKWDLPADIQSVATEHHEIPQTPVAEMQNLVQLGVALADSLGFDVIPAEHPYTLQEIRGLLPHSAQYRFDPDAAGLKARISERLDSFD